MLIKILFIPLDVDNDDYDDDYDDDDDDMNENDENETNLDRNISIWYGLLFCIIIQWSNKTKIIILDKFNLNQEGEFLHEWK